MAASPQNATIVVIEDDRAIRLAVTMALRAAGYATLEAATIPAARELLAKASYHLVLLDLVLPGGDGLDVLRELRAVNPAMPVLILSARGDERDRIEGLRRGADDYVVKPFSVAELLERVAALRRRCPVVPASELTITLGSFTADLASRSLRKSNGDLQDLSEREAEMLRCLHSHQGRVVSRALLYRLVWRIEGPPDSRAVDMAVARLRKKLGGEADALLRTVRGDGYQLCVGDA